MIAGLGYNNDTDNIFISATDKNDISESGTSTYWITSQTAQDIGFVRIPYLVKIHDDRFWVLWENTQYDVFYLYVDGKGHPTSDIQKIDAMLSNCQPILSGNKIVWYATSNSAPQFYFIDDVFDGSEPDTSSKNTFADVKEGDYFADAVSWAIFEGITNGTGKNAEGQNMFSPNATCTNAQIITFLWRSQGSPLTAGASPFSDIDYDAYYAKAAIWACINGIVPPGEFKPNEPCTRLSTVKFMWKLAGKPASTSANFDDFPAGDADAVSAAAWALANNVTNGIGGRNFGPDQTCTRGQIVTFLYRAYA